MNTYENSPQVRLVATHCACCGRPLVDAVSVESGLGPQCAKKYGYYMDCPEDVRELVNKAVYEIAIHPQSNEILHSSLKTIRENGFETLYSKLAALTSIKIEEIEGYYRVRTPYNPDFNKVSYVKGRKGKKESLEESKKPVFFWLFPKSSESKKTLWKALSECFSGQLGTGPKGPFQVP